MLYNKDKPFKILSIDGGGIRGIYPAKFLSEIEYQLEQEGKNPHLNKYFDLICGTSTGGIIAIGLALGMRASQILTLYREEKNKIFGKKRSLLTSLLWPSYNSKQLKPLLKDTFLPYADGEITRLGHAKTRVCIPVYNASDGRVSVYKTSHHPELIRDYQFPAHDVALSTSAAPMYFEPHSFRYKKKGSDQVNTITNNIDGGMFANNPALIGITDAHKTLGVPLNDLKVLSLGTGIKKFKEPENRSSWGLWYWALSKPRRIIELIFSSQTDDINNAIKFLNQGVGTSGDEKFLFERIQFEFEENDSISLDETDYKKLNQLEERAHNAFQFRGSKIIREFFKQKITPYQPSHEL